MDRGRPVRNHLMDQKRFWHTRGYISHYDGEKAQFVTFRLFDSLPKTILNKLELEKKHGKLFHYDREFQIKIEEYLDRGIGGCFLARHSIAAMVRDSLFFRDEQHYKLIAWVIMPNHIHILIRALEAHSLTTILRNFKSFTAKEANKILSRSGPFWQADYFDRFIRDGDHFAKTVRYIENNPVKAGLCSKPEEWEFSSGFGGKEFANGTSAVQG